MPALQAGAYSYGNLITFDEFKVFRVLGVIAEVYLPVQCKTLPPRKSIRGLYKASCRVARKAEWLHEDIAAALQVFSAIRGRAASTCSLSFFAPASGDI